MNIINKIGEIKEGWTNLVKDKFDVLSPEMKDLAVNRYNICNNCKFRNKKLNICNICKCYLPAKVLSLNSFCPKQEW